jgi:hypothetical protein
MKKGPHLREWEIAKESAQDAALVTVVASNAILNHELSALRYQVFH